MRTWRKTHVEHITGDTARLSVAFTWHLQTAHQRAAWLRSQGYQVLAGGPAVALMPHYLVDVAEVGSHWPDALANHNPNATFTSRGCIRACSFCAVWRTEGPLRELDDWEPRPLVCDNNLLACSTRHFDRVIDRLKPVPKIDFSQGLDARLLTKHHAERLAELDITKRGLRLAFDHPSQETALLRALGLLRQAGIAKRKIAVYVLIGYGTDTPEDSLYRLQLLRGLALVPSPMRYNPLDTMQLNSYVSPNWTERELGLYMRYWSRLSYLGAQPFDQFLEGAPHA